MIQEERRKAYQSKEVRTEYHDSLIEVEKWLSKAGQATAHHKDDTSQQTSQAIKVRFIRLIKELSFLFSSRDNFMNIDGLCQLSWRLTPKTCILGMH